MFEREDSGVGAGKIGVRRIESGICCEEGVVNGWKKWRRRRSPDFTSGFPKQVRDTDICRKIHQCTIRRGGNAPSYVCAGFVF